jgi:hypothetical protein
MSLSSARVDDLWCEMGGSLQRRVQKEGHETSVEWRRCARSGLRRYATGWRKVGSKKVGS